MSASRGLLTIGILHRQVNGYHLQVIAFTALSMRYIMPSFVVFNFCVMQLPVI